MNELRNEILERVEERIKAEENLLSKLDMIILKAKLSSIPCEA